MPVSVRSPLNHVELEEQIRKLNAIGIALSGEHDLDQLLDLIVTEARHFTNADGGSLYIKEGNRLNFRVAQTESLEKRDGGRRPSPSFYLPLTRESIAGYVALTGEVLNIEDVYDVPPTVAYRINKQFDIQNNYRSKSMLVVPMRDHTDNIIGVLQLINSMDEHGCVIPFEPEFEELILSLASQAAVAIRNVNLIEEIKNLFRSLVQYSARAIDARSPHTAGHSGRVAKYCVRMAHAINAASEGRFRDVRFTPEEIEELRMAGWLHDIGKIGVRESVLEKTNKLTDEQLEIIVHRFELIKNKIRADTLEQKCKMLQAGEHDTKVVAQLESELVRKLQEIDELLAFIKRINTPGFLAEEDQRRLQEIADRTYVNNDGVKCKYLTPGEVEHLSVVRGNLTEDEYKEVQSHVEQTLSILNKIPFTDDLKNIPKHAAAHHEYLDGSGYPRGLQGDEISLQSRILCVADIFDALNSPDRPYKEALPLEKSFGILREEVRAGKIDGDIVELFIQNELYQRPTVVDEDD